LSTLTKVLIVLLTVASIFLCGIVVTYVANAENYKQKYETQNNSFQAAKRNETNAKAQLNSTVEEMNREAEKLKERLAALDEKNRQLEAYIVDANRQRDDALNRVNSWATIVKDFSATVENNQRLLKEALAARDANEVKCIKLDKQLKDTTAALMENMAIVRQLQDESKRLVEEKTELQNKLDMYLRQYGKVAAEPTPVTPAQGVVSLVPPVKDIDLNGSITEVDLKNLLAEISIGSADGVREGMRFHLTRGDQFICDLVVLDVLPDRAVGWLDLLEEQSQNPPQIDDRVSTNL
jgi:cell shape-determining protein MreC